MTISINFHLKSRNYLSQIKISSFKCEKGYLFSYFLKIILLKRFILNTCFWFIFWYIHYKSWYFPDKRLLILKYKKITQIDKNQKNYPIFVRFKFHIFSLFFLVIFVFFLLFFFVFVFIISFSLLKLLKLKNKYV